MDKIHILKAISEMEEYEQKDMILEIVSMMLNNEHMKEWHEKNYRIRKILSKTIK
jgi:hypothetical protein